MKISKIISKKAVLVAITAAGALIAGSASAGIRDVAGNHGPRQLAHADLKGYNDTRGCVRFYVNPNYHSDIAAGHTIDFGWLEVNHKYYASVFSGACGGKATRTVSYITHVSDTKVNSWHVTP